METIVEIDKYDYLPFKKRFSQAFNHVSFYIALIIGIGAGFYSDLGWLLLLVFLAIYVIHFFVVSVIFITRIQINDNILEINYKKFDKVQPTLKLPIGTIYASYGRPLHSKAQLRIEKNRYTRIRQYETGPWNKKMLEDVSYILKDVNIQR